MVRTEKTVILQYTIVVAIFNYNLQLNKCHMMEGG